MGQHAARPSCEPPQRRTGEGRFRASTRAHAAVCARTVIAKSDVFCPPWFANLPRDLYCALPSDSFSNAGGKNNLRRSIKGEYDPHTGLNQALLKLTLKALKGTLKGTLRGALTGRARVWFRRCGGAPHGLPSSAAAGIKMGVAEGSWGVFSLYGFRLSNWGSIEYGGVII